MAWFEHSGSRIYFEELGSGAPALLLPGFSQSSEHLAALRDALATRATCKKQSQAWDVLYITVCEPIRPTSRNAWCERWLTVSPCEKPRAALVWR